MGRCHDGAVQTRPAGCPALETERLLLRPFRDDDLDDYFAVLDTPEVRRWLHLPAGLTRSDAWQRMAGFMGQWALRGTGQWASSGPVGEWHGATIGGFDMNVGAAQTVGETKGLAPEHDPDRVGDDHLVSGPCLEAVDGAGRWP